MKTASKRSIGRAALLAAAVTMLATVATAPASPAKTTKKKTATSKRPATTKKATATTAPAIDQGQAKNITGQEVPAGEPIKIGVMGFTGSEFSGDLAEMYEIAFDTLRKKGEIPVNGRDIVLYFRGIPAFAPDQAAAARAACTALAQDDKVFAAVIYVHSAACLSGDYKIPAITGSSTEEDMERAWPYIFAQSTNPNRSLRNVAPWADSLGLLKGRKLGLFHGTAPGRQKQIDDHFKPQLKKLGYSIAEEMASGATRLAPDAAADRVAVQRFKNAGVDTVFYMGAQPAEFAKAAVAQGFKPKFIWANLENSFICGGCAAGLAGGISPALIDGTYGLAGGRFVEDGLGGNPPPAPEGLACANNYEKLSGIRVRQQGAPAEQTRYQSVQWSCDQARSLVTALKAAGPRLTQGALINALETSIKKQKSGFIADITFSRTNHFGSNDIRTVKLDGACYCWKAVGGLREPFVD